MPDLYARSRRNSSILWQPSAILVWAGLGCARCRPLAHIHTPWAIPLPRPQQDAPDSAPESGTLRGEAPYPFDREASGATSSEEEEPGEYAAPESGDLRGSQRTPRHSRPA